MRLPYLIIDHPDRERYQRELIGPSLAVHTTNRAAPEVLWTVKGETLIFILVANMPAKKLCSFRCGHYYKIIPANMTDKVIGIAILAHHTLTNSSHQANQIVTCEEPVDIIKSLEVVEIEVEHTPRGHAFEHFLDGHLNLKATRQADKRREKVLLYASKLCANTGK